jgi:CheY-like chemotaxis protein
MEIKGTGLGLSIVYELVKILGGTLTLISEVGKGSEFCVCIPVEPSEKQVFSEDQETETLANTKLLLVDDNQFNILVAEQILICWGVEVVCASNGAEALEKVQNEPFDLVLMDLQMPVMDGYESFSAIRNLEDPVISAIPIIALTADSTIHNKKRVSELGFNGYITKPFNPDEFRRTLRKNLPKSI